MPVVTHPHTLLSYTRNGVPSLILPLEHPSDLWHLMRARYYEPSTGRFITKDPFPGETTNPQSMNPYIYASNNPINNTDPSGLCDTLFFTRGVANKSLDLIGTSSISTWYMTEDGWKFNPKTREYIYDPAAQDRSVDDIGLAISAVKIGVAFAALRNKAIRAGLNPKTFKWFNSRKAAFRAAKTENNIPVSEQPLTTIHPEKWAKNGRLLPDGRQYKFKNGTTIRDDAWGGVYKDDPSQNIPAHFNVEGSKVHYIYGKP